ncbi:ribosome maturation factor RimM [Mycoplasmatota bacterium]|nr:ribosome maturation factor RimM [Mycoplasmatota bacterium]
MNYQLVGKITGFKGIKGELKVKPLSGFIKERLQANAKIYIEIDGNYQEFNVMFYHENQKIPLLKLKGYENINLVQFLNKKEIFVDADEEIMIEENAYHQDELIGLKIYQNNILKGQVVDIRNYPKDDYLVVETDKGNVLIPFRDEFIKEMKEDYIDIVDLEGLF